MNDRLFSSSFRFLLISFRRENGKKISNETEKVEDYRQNRERGKKEQKGFSEETDRKLLRNRNRRNFGAAFFGGSCCGEKKLLKTENQEKIHSVKKSWAETKHIFGVSGEVII